MAENNSSEGNQNLNISPERSPFTKLDNKRRNLHSEDVDRKEIAKGNPVWDTQNEKELQEEPWKKNQ